jgi:hypothetical protein
MAVGSHFKCRAGENPISMLVPIYVFPEMKLCGLLIENRIIMFLSPVSAFMYLGAIDIYSQDWSAYFAAAK